MRAGSTLSIKWEVLSTKRYSQSWLHLKIQLKNWSKRTNYALFLWYDNSSNFPLRSVSRTCSFCGGTFILDDLFVGLVISLGPIILSVGLVVHVSSAGSAGSAYSFFVLSSVNLLQALELQRSSLRTQMKPVFQTVDRREQRSVVAWNVRVLPATSFMPQVPLSGENRIRLNSHLSYVEQLDEPLFLLILQST